MLFSQKIDIPNDFYIVTIEEAFKTNGTQCGRLKREGKSVRMVFDILLEGMPEYDWKPWLFSPQLKLQLFWENERNHHEFFNWLSHELNHRSCRDWYSVTSREIHSRGGNFIKDYYCNSASLFLISRMPGENWKVWKFANPQWFWNEKELHRPFLRSIMRRLGVKTPGCWSCITQKDISSKIRERYFLSYYDCSLKNFLLVNNPELDLEALPLRIRQGEEEKMSDRIGIWMKWIKSEFRISSIHQWFSPQVHKFMRQNSFGVLKEFENSPLRAILSYFSTKKKEMREIESWEKKSQAVLLTILKNILSSTISLQENCRLLLENNERDKNQIIEIELDILASDISLAFEYQGSHHYQDSCPCFLETKYVQHRDKNKSHWCRKLGITLIPIPFWWEKNISVLREITKEQRPDITIKT